MKTLFLLIVLLLLSAIGEAATYYVATTGSDSNPGTIGSPFLNPQKCHTVMVAGDTCYLRGGSGGSYNIANPSYGSRVLDISTQGVAGNPITYAAYPGEIPILSMPAQIYNCGDPQGQCSGTPLFVLSAYVVIDGIYVNGGRIAMIVQGHHNTVRNTDVSGGWNGGLQCDGLNNSLIEKNYVHENNVANWPRGAFAARSNVPWGSGLTCQGTNVTNMIVQDNIIYWNHGEGLQVGSVGGQNNLVQRNIVADNWSVPGFYCDGCGPGIVVDSNLFYITTQARNWPCPGASCPIQTFQTITGTGPHDLTGGSPRSYECGICFGVEIDSGGVGTNSGVVVRNNIVVNTNGGVVFFSNTGGPQTVSNVTIDGNSFIDDNTGMGFFPGLGGVQTGWTIRNNISTDNSYSLFTMDPDLTNSTVDHNLWFGTANGCGSPPCWFSHSGAQTWSSGGFLGTNSINADPLLVDSTFIPPRLWNCDQICINQAGNIGNGTDPHTVDWAAVIAHYKLTSGSPAKDTGITLPPPYDKDYLNVQRPVGSQFDMGALEFNGTATPTHDLTLASSNPTTGCTISLSFTDNFGHSSANTQWDAFFFEGTVVSVTAASTCSGNNFQKWQKDGVDYSVSISTPITVDTNHTLTAFYQTPAATTHNLTVFSVNPSSLARISITPNDNQSRNSGGTQFSRVYNSGVPVTLIARSTANSPLVFLKCDEGSGTTCADSSNDALTGTLTNGPTWTTPGLGSSAHAVQLNGTTQYIQIPNSTLLNNFVALSLGIKVKPSAALTTSTALINKGPSQYFLYAAHSLCSNKPMFGFSDTQDVTHYICGNTALTNGVEADLRGTFDGGTLNYYLNGVSDATPVAANAVIEVTNGVVQIGASVFGENFNGIVDNIEIFDFAQSVDAPGNNFQAWSGCDSATTFTCNVTMSADKSVTANYVTAGVNHTISVTTVNPTNVTGMSVDTVDINGSATSNLTAPFTRTYPSQSTQYVTFSTPLTSGSNTFVAWAGCDSVNVGVSLASCHVFPNADFTITATYSSPTVRALTLVSVNPSSGVAITGITSDLSSQTSCTTPNCALTYNDSTSVVATAPATVGSNTFSAWTGCTSVSGAGNRTCNMTMNADKVGTVTYTTPPAACTTGIKAGSVTITVKGSSLIAKCNGG